MVITPIEKGGETHPQIQLLAHFDLKGTISSQACDDDSVPDALCLTMLCFMRCA